ncbi:MAG: pentapeptide repeat-containing protein [Pelatocladus maniniholoensis HA4357-MV3]|jgi:uncharacterized protein YjbI with pentapeptide repeats|uniref:Pentapeptide repeat-containing protein n=1 Tax=Pelatocladus maniniholoensis HA4357-MV3 TaxID=1117104 RepID=A0A9E3LRT1_9NOST|nr:pentapeptide repeat-containing protein [Pelatocladus maniniholoensis HA4357-MV3]BAZ71086.1 pentapeptide repeat-containing protein [Fischerella sp. NIES-4106]
MSTNLRGAKLYGANFQNSDLRGANFQHFDLQGVNFQQANFQDTNLKNAKFGCIKFTGKNKQCTNLSNVKSLTPEQVKAAKNWQQACYDSEFRKKLGLPPENQKECIEPI